MTDELHRKLFRRKRKHKGETWNPDTRNSPNNELGPWCRHCRSTHPWRNKKTLGVAYEKRNGVWIIMWTCLITGNVIKEEGLVRK